MRFLANENVPLDAIVALRQAGHDVVWIRTEAPGSKDEEILDQAVKEERILLTFDKDFGELAFRSRLPASCGIVLFRITASGSEHLARIVTTALETDTEWSGHFSVVERNRIRVRLLPQQ